MTKKLYYENMYTAESNAVINSVEGNRIILDQTIFFPEGGGQVGDTGFINDYRVMDTQKKISKDTKTIYHKEFPVIQVNSDVAHVLEETPTSLFVGQRVNLKLDWNRRYNIMRMHSAAHVVYYFTFKVMGQMPVKGCYIKDDSSRFDFGLPIGMKLEKNLIEEIEAQVNDFMSNNLDISNVPLENEPEALYWVCGDVKIPCGGTHVKNTSEIGRIVLSRKSQGKNVDRLYIAFT